MYVMWVWETGWPTGTASAIPHAVDEGIFLPSVSSGYSEQLHSSLCMWWEEYFTEIYELVMYGIC
jgi:hypothetical protein